MEINECISRLKSDFPEDDKMYITLKDFVSEKDKEINALKEQVRWRKYPKEKPTTTDKYLVKGTLHYVCFYDKKNDMWSWEGDYWEPTYWLPIPELNK